MSGKQTSEQAYQAIPRSRYLLFLGALLAIPLAFVPWITAGISFWYPGNFGATWVLASYNPVQIYSMLLGIPSYLTVVDLALVGGSCLPGLCFSVWLRGRVQSSTQRMGVALYSIWLLLFTTANTYAVFGMLYDSLIFQRMLWIHHVSYWRADIGVFVWVLTLALLWVALVLLWREMPYAPGQLLVRIVRRPYTLRDGGMALVALGAICWFIGYYGMYWYLPESCRAVPLFGFAPCMNQLDTMVGFVSAVTRLGDLPWRFSQVIYWSIGSAVVLGGILLVVYLWKRQSAAGFPLRWVLLWVAGITLLTGTSCVGAAHLAGVYPEERATAGFPLTLVGALLLTGGLLMYWRAHAQGVRTRAT